MHARLFNEAIFELRLRPRTPLLIKAGESGQSSLDPTLPDMYFVRTRSAAGDEIAYIPGSSFRGVIRAHAERLLRSVALRHACNPNDHEAESKGLLQPSCGVRVAGQRSASRGAGRGFGGRPSDVDGAVAYRQSCYACRLFGNTVLASRIRVSDLLPVGGGPALQTDVRYGVAIDRVTASVAHGPFELEVVTGGQFEGSLTVRNFTIGQLGLVGAALLDLADGLVPLGYGKSRGLGRVELEFGRLEMRVVRGERAPSGMPGVGALVDPETRSRYGLPPEQTDRLEVGASPAERGPYRVYEATGETARRWLEAASGRWLEEVRAA